MTSKNQRRYGNQMVITKKPHGPPPMTLGNMRELGADEARLPLILAGPQGTSRKLKW
jgi:hypothetical protein